MGNIDQSAGRMLLANLMGMQAQLTSLSQALMRATASSSGQGNPLVPPASPVPDMPFLGGSSLNTGLPGLGSPSDLTLTGGGFSFLPPMLSGLGLDNLTGLSDAILDPTRFMGGSNLEVFNYTTLATNTVKLHALAGRQLLLKAQLNGHTIDSKMSQLGVMMGEKLSGGSLPGLDTPTGEDLPVATEESAPTSEKPAGKPSEKSDTSPESGLMSNSELSGKDWKGKMGKPVKARAGSPYGRRFHPIDKINKLHTGQDYPAAAGTPIRAAADGVVEFAGDGGAFGNLVKISHGGKVQTWYAHMSRFGTHKKKTVKKGDIIGYVGSTGKSTGPHLHFEVRVDGQPVSPLAWLA